MKLPNDKNAAWAANEYTSWLPHAFWQLLRVEVSAENNVLIVFVFAQACDAGFPIWCQANRDVFGFTPGDLKIGVELCTFRHADY